MIHNILPTIFRYLFESNKWLDSENGEHAQLILPAATTSNDENAAVLFKKNMSKQFFDEHLWVSVGVRKSPTGFTRSQRLGCCLAILFLTMIANAMWYTTDTKRDNVQAVYIGPLSFTVHELYTSVVSSLTVLPPIVLITLFFTKSAKQATAEDTNSNNSNNIENKRRKNELPYWSVYIGWVLVFLSVALAAFFTILYSIQWGLEISSAWLTSFLLSFIQSIILLQPLQVCSSSVDMR